MDKQAFKQRMQNLKSYRENNPGKGYWDWRNSLPDNLKYTDDTEYNMRGAYESGAQPILENDGFYHLPTRNPQTGEILKTSLHPTFWKGLAEDAKIGYNTYFVGDKVYTKSKEEGPINVYADGGEVGNPSVQAIQQKQWLNDWLKSRSKQMAENIDFYSNQNIYGSSMDRMHVSPFFFQDKEKNAAKIIQEQLQYANNIPIYDYREPWVAVNKDIPNRKEFLKMNSGVQGAYHKKYGQPNTISISPIATDRSVILHELSHSTQDKYNIQSSKIDDILKRYQKENHNYDKYYDNPDEVYSRMNQFRYDNNIRPEDIITKEQIEQWKDSSIDNEFINRYSTNTLLDLLNSVAQAFEKGGEVGNPNDDFTKAINIKLGRTSDGRPKEQGLKPVIDLKDAANITPIGDALSARDVYNAVTEKDWTGAGLAALGILPFIPSGLQKAKKAIKQIPTVNKNTQSLLDAKFSQLEKLDQAKSNYANEQYRIIERVMEDPSYTNRANEVRKQFGDDYSIPYADMFIAYNMDPSLLPNVQLMDDLTKAGTMGRTADGKFIYRRTPDNDYIPNTAEHELSHFTDLLKSGRTDAHAGNNMFYQMSKDLTKRVGDGHDNYFLLPTEQKAHMNQLREWMFKNGYINKRDQKITTEYMSKILKKLQNIEGTKGLRRAAQQFKSNRTFTKWFNSIPLIGVGAIGVNKYFADENKQKE